MYRRKSIIHHTAVALCVMATQPVLANEDYHKQQCVHAAKESIRKLGSDSNCKQTVTVMYTPGAAIHDCHITLMCGMFRPVNRICKFPTYDKTPPEGYLKMGTRLPICGDGWKVTPHR